MDLDDPTQILARLPYPILEAAAPYENQGLRANTVFSNGMVVIGDTLYVYYGGADQFTAVATVEVSKLLAALTK